jgi:capsular polysaccharide biosynthesis protein
MAASLEQKQKAERFTVLDPAQPPEKPVSPKRKVLLALAILVSMALPCLFVIGNEILRATITTEAEVKSLLPAGVRIVGLIPHIRKSSEHGRSGLFGVVASFASLVMFALSLLLVWQMRSSL